jgi:hypothetical protein
MVTDLASFLQKSPANFQLSDGTYQRKEKKKKTENWA